MKEGWKMVKFEDAIQKVTYTNKISSNSYKTNGCYPIVSQEKDLINGYWNNEDDLFKVQKPIIIFGDHTKVVKYIDFDFVLGADGVKILLPHDGIDSKFFYYYVSSIDLRDLGYARHYKLLKEKNIPLPPLEEQHRIVGILDAAFAKIDALKANTEANLTNAKALFQQVLAQELQPKEGWETKRLDEIATFYNGKAHEQCIDENGEYILVNSKYISSDTKIGKRTSNQLFPLYKDDIVMVMSDVPNGKALAKCLIIPTNGTHSLNQRICAFRNSKINVRLLYYLINRNPYLLSFNNGENQTNLRKNDILKMQLSYPTDEAEVIHVLKRLDEQIYLINALIKNKEQTIRECDALKQSILRQAFSGEL